MTSWAVMVSLIDQPTARLENRACPGEGRECLPRTLQAFSGEEYVEGDFEHVLGLGGALGS